MLVGTQLCAFKKLVKNKTQLMAAKIFCGFSFIKIYTVDCRTKANGTGRKVKDI